jgi:WXG100 family type VII secretion target
MSYIKVTAEELHNVSGTLSSAAQTINDTNSSALSQVNNLVGAGWEGAASAQFDALFTSWKQGADQVQQALHGISDLLRGAGTTYANAEDQIRQSMSQG